MNCRRGTRLEGSLGIPESEFNGPVVGLQQVYREGVARLGADFSTWDPRSETAPGGARVHQVVFDPRLRGHIRCSRVRRKPRPLRLGLHRLRR